MADGDRAMGEVELGDVEKKVPRKVIHFASGETMEEYSTEEEDEEDHQKVDFCNVDTQMSWRTFVQFWILRIATSAFFTCDYLGGQLAALFGLNVSKYQYAIDEYHKAQEEDSDFDDENEDENVKKTGNKNAPNEGHHLQMQSMDYGTIQDNHTESGDKYRLDSEILQPDH
ncbi:protein FAM177B isoform X2 [Dendrobates tinctorius]|uniref:protein FAM177B isoform X2 n=1 Tax=Dendrobates tinctorius TaxID=92724 RepID=UPI003CCA02D7